jgi:hypothetical protein
VISASLIADLSEDRGEILFREQLVSSGNNSTYQDVARDLREVAAIAGDQPGDPPELEPPAADDVQAATGPGARRVSGLVAHVEDRAEQISGIRLLSRENHARLRG